LRGQIIAAIIIRSRKKRNKMNSNSNTAIADAGEKNVERPFPADLQARNEAAIRLLDAWCKEDAQEQQETWAFLKQALEEDRLSARKLFP
jgi:hypothetical protein